MKTNQNDTLKWLYNKMKDKIFVEEQILDYENPIRGVYGIFVTDDIEERCVYVGRATNIYNRIFCGASAHLVKLRKEICENQKINNAMKNKKEKIEIRVLAKVPCLYDNYNKDMQRLASKESYYIDYFQGLNQCLEQRPDGRNMEEKIWLIEYERFHEV
ncbi:hypothetical protein AAGC94_09570 [Clostridium sporogenes]|uniref:hypothetical protein n=1 Tax=Clostridium sporogenes TaxID=1509 RepID=UPI00313CDD6B